MTTSTYRLRPVHFVAQFHAGPVIDKTTRLDVASHCKQCVGSEIWDYMGVSGRIDSRWFKPASHSYLVVLIRCDRDKGSFSENMGAESRVFRPKSVIFVGLYNMQPGLVFVHRI